MTTRSAHNVRSKRFFFIESLINNQQRITGNKKNRTAVRARKGDNSYRQTSFVMPLGKMESIRILPSLRESFDLITNGKISLSPSDTLGRLSFSGSQVSFTASHFLLTPL